MASNYSQLPSSDYDEFCMNGTTPRVVLHGPHRKCISVLADFVFMGKQYSSEIWSSLYSRFPICNIKTGVSLDLKCLSTPGILSLSRDVYRKFEAHHLMVNKWGPKKVRSVFKKPMRHVMNLCMSLLKSQQHSFAGGICIWLTFRLSWVAFLKVGWCGRVVLCQ